MEHVPGAELAADLLTKPVSVLASWESFRSMVGLSTFVQPSASAQLCRLVEATVAVGALMLQKGTSSVVKTAGAVTLAALTALMCCHEGLATMAKGMDEKTNPRPVQEQEKRSNENERDPTRANPCDYSTDSSPEGFLGSLSPTRPRLMALRAGWGHGPQPWLNREFNQPPYAANDDVWIMMDAWVVRIHRSLRTRRFHPVHRSCPVRINDLEPQRVSVIWWSGPRGWEKSIQHDEWGTGNADPDPPVQGQWRGWTFFRLAESNQVGASSSNVRRLQPDVVTWTPQYEDAPYPMPVQMGRSSSSLRRGHVSAAERGAAAMAFMNTGQSGADGESAASSATYGSWSVAGSGDGYRADLAAGVLGPGRPLSSSPPGPSPPPSSAPSSLRPGGTSTSSMPVMRPRPSPAIPPGSTVLMRPMASPNRWNDGPSMSIREGETERTAGLRALQAPLPPVLHPGRPSEDPQQRRQRYQTSARREVSDPDLWDFLHGSSPDPEGSCYDEAVESEVVSDGDYSLVTDRPEDPDDHGGPPSDYLGTV